MNPIKPVLMLFLIGCLPFFFMNEARSQNRIVSGTVIDSTTSLALSGAFIIEGTQKIQVLTDKYGEFSFNAYRGFHQFSCSYLGYKTVFVNCILEKDTNILFRLSPEISQIKEVTIVSSLPGNNSLDVQSASRITSKELSKIPQFLGSSDYFKTLQLLPGIQNSGEGNAAIYIRGGGPDENLVLLDGAVIYNPTHLLGFYSVFNGDVIKDVTLYKSGIPAEFGNRMSSVLDFTSNQGMPEKTEVKGNIGLITANLKISVPIPDVNASLFLSMRQTYLNLILSGMRDLKLISNHSILKSSSYDFYDINGGLSISVSERNRIYLSVYTGDDDFDLNAPLIQLDATMNWGNKMSSLTWTHLITSDCVIENSLVLSAYDMNMHIIQNDYNLYLNSNIRDYGFKSKTTFSTVRQQIKAGLEVMHHLITPNTSTATSDTQALSTPRIYSYFALENSIFLSDEIKWNDHLSVVAGIRGNLYFQLGPYSSFLYNSSGIIMDTLNYSTGKIIQPYWDVEPRISLRYLLDKDDALKLSYNYNNQYIHLVSASSVAFPTDFWIPSTKLIKPLTGNQWYAGFYKHILPISLETSVEVYYKNTQNEIAFNNDWLELFNDAPADANLIFGKGRSYGIEFLAKKTSGSFTGWLGYTLSKTEQSFPLIENGQWFAAKYDRTHNGTCVINYFLNQKWSFSFVFVYSTGTAYTPIVGKYLISGNVINQYGAYNSARMPDYSRMDLAATYVLINTLNKSSKFIFSIYNVLDTQNPFFIYPQSSGNISNFTINIEPKELSIFPILPSVSWQFSF